MARNTIPKHNHAMDMSHDNNGAHQQDEASYNLYQREQQEQHYMRTFGGDRNSTNQFGALIDHKANNFKQHLLSGGADHYSQFSGGNPIGSSIHKIGHGHLDTRPNESSSKNKDKAKL